MDGVARFGDGSQSTKNGAPKRKRGRADGASARVPVKESEIQADIVAYLLTQGFVHWDARSGDLAQSLDSSPPNRAGLFWRNYVGPMVQGNGRRTPNPAAGLPDIEGILSDGRYFGIEVKTPEGTTSFLQRVFLYHSTRVSHGRAVVFVARSVYEVAAKMKELT